MPLPAPHMAAPPHQAQWQAPAVQSRRPTALIPLLVVFYSFLLLPPEVEINVFGVNLPSYRQALLLMAVPALRMILNNRRGSVSPIDIVVMIMGFWIMLSFMTIYGFGSGIIRGAGIVTDTVLIYMIARACIRAPDELRYFLILCLPGLMFAGGSLAVESLSGQLLLRPMFQSIFGNIESFAGGEATGALFLEHEYRIGMLRAYGPFPHPILAGAVMVGFLPLYYFSGLRSWPYFFGVAIAFTGFFSLSSAAFLGLMMSIAAIAVNHVKPYVPKISWWTLVSMLVLLAGAVHVSTKNGIVPVLARMTLTPATAEYRTLIWEYGSASVAKNPWFGIGYKQWDRLSWMAGDSVDAHFLLLAMRHGLNVPVLFLAGIIYGMIKLGTIMPSLTPRDRTLMLGLNITMFVYVIVGQTVNYFGSTGLVFMTMVALLASMVEWGKGELKVQTQMRMMQTRSSLFAPPPQGFHKA
jgi:O-antigen ligase